MTSSRIVLVSDNSIISQNFRPSELVENDVIGKKMHAKNQNLSCKNYSAEVSCISNITFQSKCVCSIFRTTAIFQILEFQNQQICISIDCKFNFKFSQIKIFEFYNNAHAKIRQNMILNNRFYSITSMSHSNDSHASFTLNLYFSGGICHNYDSEKNSALMTHIY